MLKQRVVTAVILLAVLAFLLSLHSPWLFLIFLAIVCGATAWEWWRLTMPTMHRSGIALGFILFVFALIQIPALISQSTDTTQLLNLSVWLSVLFWFVAVLPTVIFGSAERAPRSVFWSLFAPIALFSTWLCLAVIYLEHGAKYLLSLLAVVWVADIAAYFGGKAFGRHKLALRISPGKTIEGALFGIAGVVAWVLISAHWAGTFGHALTSRWGWGITLALAILLAVVSIAGDLFESLLKRRAGFKDSSNLLPGHGGVFDRIDAVIAVVPLAFLLVKIS